MGRLGDGARRMMFAPLRALLPKHPVLRWLVILLPILAVLAFLEPAVGLLFRVFDLGVRVLEPLLVTTLGRIVLLLLAVAIAGLLAATLLRGRIATFYGKVLLGRHLEGIAALLDADPARSRTRFQRVSRQKNVQPAEYPFLAQDANLKLARLCLEAGDAEGALRHVALVVEPGLPRELRRSLLQLRVMALRLHGNVLPETLAEETRAGLQEFADDYVLLRELRALVRQRGDLLETAELQARVAKAAPPATAAAERQQWIDDLVAAALQALETRDLELARRLQKKLARLGGPQAGLLLGEIHVREGDVRAAVRAFGATRSPEGLERIAALLREHPGCMEPREILECCPLQGALLVLAREFARQGHYEQAERAARQAAQVLGPTPTVCAVLAEVLGMLGRDAEARLLGEQAVRHLLGDGAST